MTTVEELPAVASLLDAPPSESMVNDETKKFTDAIWPVGSGAYQGDVLLLRIDGMPSTATRRSNHQLAVGDTQGSRHVLVGGEVYDCDYTEVAAIVKNLFPKFVVPTEDCFGPVFRTTSDSDVLYHPEHGDHAYEKGMIVAVLYAQAMTEGEIISRILD
jgi:hypothetical protein